MQLAPWMAYRCTYSSIGIRKVTHFGIAFKLVLEEVLKTSIVN
jgi:hypothetical protein